MERIEFTYDAVERMLAEAFVQDEKTSDVVLEALIKSIESGQQAEAYDEMIKENERALREDKLPWRVL